MNETQVTLSRWGIFEIGKEYELIVVAPDEARANVRADMLRETWKKCTFVVRPVTLTATLPTLKASV